MKNGFIYFTLGILLSLGACRSFDSVVIERVDGEVLFSHEKEKSLNKKQLFVRYLEVARSSATCQSDCSIWHVGIEEAPQSYQESDFVKFPIRYGQQLPKLKETVPPSSIESGDYVVSGVVDVIKDNKVVDQIDFNQNFTLD